MTILATMLLPPTKNLFCHVFTISKTCKIALSLTVFFLRIASAADFYVSSDGSDQNTGATTNAPFATVMKALKTAAAGDTIYLRGGTYREGLYVYQRGGTADAPLTLTAYPGEQPVLKGSDVVTGWENHSGAIWKKIGWTANSQQVFCDGKFLQQIGLPSSSYDPAVYTPVGSGLQDMRPSSYFYDAPAQTLYVWLPDGRDPNSAVMEASVRDRILWLDVPFLHVSGLTLRHSNSSSRVAGGFAMLIGADSVLENCDIQWCDFEGLEVRSRTLVQNCVISNNGDVGVGGGGSTDYIVRHCVISGNNYRNFSSGWHAGGLKLVSNSSGIVEECEVSNNNGNAIWFDNCKSGKPIVIRNNQVRNNDKTAVFVEISVNALVYNNQIVGNRERGVYISASDLTKTLNNTIVGTSGHGALTVGGMPRQNATLSHNRVFNNVIFGSTCTFDLFFPKDNGGDTFDNLCDYNCYFRTSGPLLLATTGASFQDLGAWKAATGFDASSINENPQFTLANPEDFSTSPMSGVVDKGMLCPEVPEDIRGLARPQGGGQDMGAYETSWQDLTAPAPPAGLKVTPTSWNSFHLQWGAAKDNVGVAYYELYRDGGRRADVAGLEFDDTGLDTLKTYQYFVVAVDESGLISDISNVFTVSTGTPPDLVAPSAPGSVYAVAKARGTIALSWDAATDNVGVTKYCLFRNGARVTFVNAPWFTDCNLASKTDYDYTVTAFDDAGNESPAARVKRVRTLP